MKKIRKTNLRRRHLPIRRKYVDPIDRLVDTIPMGLHQYQLQRNGNLIFRGGNPAADRILGINHDIKQTERALAESEHRYRTLVELSPESIIVHSDGKLVYVNPAAVRQMGADRPEQILGMSILDLLPPETHQLNLEILEQVAQGKSPPPLQQTILRPDGSEVEVEILGAPVLFQGKQAFQLIVRDITERKLGEKALRASEEKFRTMIEQNSEGVVLYDENGLIIEWNAAQEHISGILSKEALGRPAWDVQFQVLASEQKTHERYEAMKERGLSILQTGQSPIFNHPVEALIHRPDGTRVLIQQTSFPIKTSLGFRIGSIMRDITDRKQAELDLKRRMVELEALHAVALAGTEAMSLDELLVQVAGIIRAKLYPDHFDVAFLDKEGQFLTFHPSFFTQETYLVGLQVPLYRGISGAVAHTGIPRRVDDVCLDPNYLKANADTRSELCVPIIIGDRVVGVINLESAKLGYFTEADERLVTAIAGELGTAIEKIRILEEERNRRKELEALEQISAVLRTVEDKDEILQSVLERMMSALDLHGAVLASLDPQTGDLVTELGMGRWVFAKGIHIPQGSGVSRQTVTSQHYYLNNEIGEDEQVLFHDSLPRLKCLVCLALIVDGQTHGLLYLGRASAFISKDVHLAIAMADALASALHRIELHAQTRRHLDRLMALRAIDQSILSRLDMEQTLDVILEKITGLLHVDAANILLYNAQTKTLQVSAERGVSSPLLEDILLPGGSSAGRVTQNLEMVFLPDLSQIEHSPTGKMSQMGENFVSYAAVPLVAKGELIGVLQIFTHSRLEPSLDWMGFLEALTDQTAIAINSAQLFDEQKQTNARLTKAYEDTIDGWSRALDLRDKETEGHSQRVTDLTLELARRMDISEEQLVHIRRGAKLHDIGKMGIPDSILLKPDKLTQAEWEIMRQHPIFAAALLYPIEFLGPALEIPFAHHERWDGTGYPLGLKGEEIPLAARIFAVMDVWDAITHDRPYRPGWNKAKALEYIREQSGKHFDPRVIEEFLVMPLDGSIPNPF